MSQFKENSNQKPILVFVEQSVTHYEHSDNGIGSVRDQLENLQRRKTVFVKIPVISSSVICQTTGPKLLVKRFLNIIRSRASSFNSQYPLLSLRSSSNFLRHLTCLLVTSICPFIFPSITCFRRQFLRKM